MTDAYWERVVAHSIAEIKAGRTPNPDILCNSRWGSWNDTVHVASGCAVRAHLLRGQAGAVTCGLLEARPFMKQVRTAKLYCLMNRPPGCRVKFGAVLEHRKTVHAGCFDCVAIGPLRCLKLATAWIPPDAPLAAGSSLARSWSIWRLHMQAASTASRRATMQQSHRMEMAARHCAPRATSSRTRPTFWRI